MQQAFRTLLVLLVFGVVILGGCNKIRQELQEFPGVEPSAIPDAIYPHSVEFKKTRLHGSKYYDDSQKCAVCHEPGVNLRGTHSATSCKSCHGVFPHTQEFKTSAQHGSAFLKDRAVCATCHGSDKSGGNSKVACQRCHEYPHGSGWTLPTNHGAKFVETNEGSGTASRVACLHCHGENSAFKEKHKEQFVSCSSCHVLLPHDEEFKNGGHQTIARTYDGKCTRCHVDQRRLMPNTYGYGCYMCHHDDKWVPRVEWKKKSD